MYLIKNFMKSLPLNNTAKVVEILSPIIDKKNELNLNIILGLVVKPILKLLAPSKRELILFFLTLFLTLVAYLLKIVGIKYYLLAACLALVTLLGYSWFSLRFASENKNKLKEGNPYRPYSSKLISSISGEIRTSLEIALDPEISRLEEDAIAEKLLDLSSVEINYGIIYFTHQRELGDKFDKYVDQFTFYFTAIWIVLFYGIGRNSQLIISGSLLFFAYINYRLHKGSMTSKLGLCLRLLQKVQTLNNDQNQRLRKERRDEIFENFKSAKTEHEADELKFSSSLQELRQLIED
jgi:hypothetical protein